MSIFATLKTEEKIEEQTDRLGGGGVLDTGVYDAKIELAYVDYAKSEAMSLNVHFDVGGRKLRQTFWMTSGKAKGCKPYYTDKSGNNHYLPGYISANDLCLLTLDQEISATDTEEKAISLYDYDLKKEVPQKKQVVTELLGQSVRIAVEKQLVDKNQKNDAGEYVPTGETREQNEVVKAFHADLGVTVTEAKAKITEPDFLNRWVEKYEGQVINKAKGAKDGAKAGAPAAGPKKSLFS